MLRSVSSVTSRLPSQEIPAAGALRAEVLQAALAHRAAPREHLLLLRPARAEGLALLAGLRLRWTPEPRRSTRSD